MKNKKINLLTKIKTFRVLLIISFCSITLGVYPKSTDYAQTKNITIELQNKTIKEIFNYIEKNSEFIFFYYNGVVDTNKRVSLSLKDQPITAVLDYLFKNSDVQYEIKDRQISLKKVTSQDGPPSVSQNAKIKVQGIIKDKEGEPIIGASVVVDGTMIGVVSDVDGKFTIDVPSAKSVLKISYIGYKTQSIPVNGKKELIVILEDDSKSLEEVVVVGYGTQKKESVVGSVQMIKPAELKVPSSNLSTGFAGRLAGVVAVQRSGEPGADGADFWIRGVSTFSGATSPLIVIDGVEASSGDLNALDPEVIEGFSILKDATATALYGSRGANGVMIVNTKSGKDLERAIVNFRFENTYSTPIKVPKFVNGTRYMEMFNEAVTTRGTGEILYTDKKIEGTRLGLDPYAFPDVDWYNEMFRSGSMNQNFNFNIRGGSKKMDYFSSASVNHDSGVLKNTDDFSYNSNLNIWRYVFQNNINAYLSKTSKLSLRLNVQLRDYNGPYSGAKGAYGMVMEANPVDFPIRYPEDDSYHYIKWGGKVGGAYNNGYRNPYAEMVRGYNSQFESTVMANLRFDQKLDFITKGLSANILFSFKNWTKTETSRSANYNQFEVAKYLYDEGGNYDGYTLRRVGAEQSTTLGTDNKTAGDRRIYIQAMLNYDRTFGRHHNVSAMLLYNQDEYNTNAPDNLIASLPKRKQGVAGRLTYDYAYRYLAEFNFGYNGSENFAAGHRFGFFPSVAVGYAISKEPYFEKLNDLITNLKVRASWGLVGNDQIANDRYLYLSDIELESGNLEYTTGRDQNVSKKGPKYNRYANPNITWEIGEKWNIGLDLGLWNDLNISIDMFKERRHDIFMKRNSIPDFLGVTGYNRWTDLKTTIYGNLGKVENKGLDFSVDYFRDFGHDFSMSFKSTFTYATNKVLEYDEPSYKMYPNLSRVGHSIDQQLLYIADRLFIDDEEVRRSAVQKLGGFIQAGDIKYVDIADANGNYDHVIDSNDRQYTGNPTVPEIVYGFGPSFRYKQWDFSFFFQGTARTSIVIGNIHPFGTDGTRNVQQFIANDYWSADNQNIYAAYPRLSKQWNGNTSAASTYWLRDGAFLKLKNAEVGFNHKFFRVYLRGSNLLTFSKFKLWDPEQGSGDGLFYPTQRVVNIGVQFSINK